MFRLNRSLQRIVRLPTVATTAPIVNVLRQHNFIGSLFARFSTATDTATAAVPDAGGEAKAPGAAGASKLTKNPRPRPRPRARASTGNKNEQTDTASAKRSDPRPTAEDMAKDQSYTQALTVHLANSDSIRSREDPTKTEAHKTLIVFATEQQIKSDATLHPLIPPLSNVQKRDFSGKVSSVHVMYPPASVSSPQRIVIVGLGSEDDLSLHAIRSATNTAIELARKFKYQTIALVVPTNLEKSNRPATDGSSDQLTLESLVDTIVRVSVLSNNDFDKYKKRSARSSHLTALWLLFPPSVNEAELSALGAVRRQAQIAATCTVFARELANDRADVVTPQYMEDRARDVVNASRGTLKMRVLSHAECKHRGYNLIGAVGQAATVPPRLIAIEYRGFQPFQMSGTGDATSTSTSTGSVELEPKTPATGSTIALVGKGITFDTGGLNLKPTGGIEDMHMDMSGSAAVLGAMKALSAMRVNANVIGILALAENAINERAVKPHAIVDTVKGSVEVSNTDAEGRLVLADALTWVQSSDFAKPAAETANEKTKGAAETKSAAAGKPGKSSFGPVTHIVDIATLTGACRAALGERCAGVFTNEGKQVRKLLQSGEATNEPLWLMPIRREHREAIAGPKAADQSDFRSTGGSKVGAGACTAAAFLQLFVNPGVWWAHLDIAGPAMLSSKAGYLPKGGTGFGTQLLTDYVLSSVHGRILRKPATAASATTTPTDAAAAAPAAAQA